MKTQTARAATQQPPILLSETLGSISVLPLNRPAARNSLSEGLIAELHAALRKIPDESKVAAVVIAANGPAFCPGHDMKEVTGRRSEADHGRAYFAEIMNASSAMMQAIVHLPKPVVAAVQGVATAAGCQLVASCDLAIASEAATFATPGVDIGLFCSTPMVALSRNVPRKQAMEMLLTGEPVDAATAQAIGLVNRVVKAGTERDAAIALAQKVALKSAYTVKLAKEAFYRQAEMNLAGASQVNVRPSYFAFKYLEQRGYDMNPVNPGHVGKSLIDKPFVASLSDIGRPVDMIDIFRNSSHIMPVVDEALKLSPLPKVIWMQLGARDDAAAAKAEAAGLKVVMNRCPKIEYGRLPAEISCMGVNSPTLNSKRAPIPTQGMRLSSNRMRVSGGDTNAS